MSQIIPDAAVVAFLESKGVASSPPSGRSALSSVAEGAITGAAGPLVGGINHIANSQALAAANAEWTSWKQWALSHADWASWYRDEWPVVLAEQVAQEAVLRQGQRSHVANTTPIAIGAVALAVVTMLLLAVKLRQEFAAGRYQAPATEYRTPPGQ